MPTRQKLLVCIAALLMCTTALMATNTLQVSSNGRYLTDSVGNAVYPQNDWATQLPWKLNPTEAGTYFAARAGQGFNLASMYAIFNCNDADSYIYSTNVYGIAPFQTDPGYYDRWDVTKPIEAYWANVDTIIDTALANGMYVALAPLPTSGLLLGSYRCMDRGDDATCYAYGNWLGKRYADKINIVWLAGVGIPQNSYFNVTSQVNALAKGIADGVNGVSNNVGVTDYSTTLMIYDTERWSHSSSYWFGSQDWLDFNSVHEVPEREGYPQYNQLTEVTDDYALTPAKPTWLLGPVSENRSGFTADQSRFQVYQTVLGGGLGTSYGNDLVENFNTGWDSNLNSDGALQMQYSKDLFAPIIANLVPDQSLIVGSTGQITGSGWYMSGSTIIQAATTSDGSNTVIYSAYGNDITVNMDQLTASSTTKARWLDPRTGIITDIGNFASNVGAPTHLFEAPGIPAQDNDVVLLLTPIPEPTLLVGGLLLGLAFLRRK